MFGRKKKEAAHPASKEERLAAIRALGSNAPVETKKHKRDHDFESEESRLNRLIDYLRDEDAECRAAAAEMLGNTTREAAITHLNYQAGKETDERALQAMNAAAISIRANIRRQHAAAAKSN